MPQGITIRRPLTMRRRPCITGHRSILGRHFGFTAGIDTTAFIVTMGATATTMVVDVALAAGAVAKHAAPSAGFRASENLIEHVIRVVFHFVPQSALAPRFELNFSAANHILLEYSI